MVIVLNKKILSQESQIDSSTYVIRIVLHSSKNFIYQILVSDFTKKMSFIKTSSSSKSYSPQICPRVIIFRETISTPKPSDSRLFNEYVCWTFSKILNFLHIFRQNINSFVCYLTIQSHFFSREKISCLFFNVTFVFTYFIQFSREINWGKFFL